MFGNRPKTAEEERRAAGLAARIAELRQERAILFCQVAVEGDVGLRMQHMHDLIKALDGELELLRREAQDIVKRASLELLEVDSELILPVHLAVSEALFVIANLQVALRHPGNVGPSADVVRGFIDGLIKHLEASGLPATAALARLGSDRGFGC